MFNILFKDDYFCSNKSITCSFYIDINGHVFPDSQWSDFALIVLNWWISSVLENCRKENADFVLFFMDGPFYVDCRKRGENIIMSCVTEKTCKAIVCECTLKFDEFVRELINASSAIIDSAKKNKYGKLKELKDLRKSLQLLILAST